MSSEDVRGWSWEVELGFVRSEIERLECELAPLREYEMFCVLALTAEQDGVD